MTESWSCGHGITYDREPPCEECCLEMEEDDPSMTEEEWRNLWDTFVSTPTWVQLDPTSQMVFKRAWYERTLPLFNLIVQAVGEFDLKLKATRN